ncbi:MAG: transglycosylase family protein [Streptococcaceae bacterium]|jgi:hypothetical protein|nr:transglycosylase family protein [Streptococcaceae bacterium]
MYKVSTQQKSQNDSVIKKSSALGAAFLVGISLFSAFLTGHVSAESAQTPQSGSAHTHTQSQMIVRTQEEINHEALLVIRGDLGNGEARVQNLTAANFDAKAVQDQVNRFYQDWGLLVAVQKSDAIQAEQPKSAVAPETSTPEISAPEASAPAAPAPAPEASTVPGDDIISYAANKMAANTGVSAAKWVEVIMAESGGNPNAVNSSSGAYGLFQLLGHGEYSGMSIDEQIAMATGVYLSQGPSAWVVW